MELAGVVRRSRRHVVTQPVEDREAMAGCHRQTSPIRATETETIKEETDISIRKAANAQPTLENGACASDFSDVEVISSTVSLGDEAVVDMQKTRQLQACLTLREPGLLGDDLSINVRPFRSSCRNAVDELADLHVLEEVEELPEKGPVTYGDDADVIQLLKEMPRKRGVICREQQVLRYEDGWYLEGRDYKIFPNTQSKGAFGEAAMCLDLRTQKTFMRKTVKGKLSRNEIEVPLKFRGNMGIPEVYGVNIKDKDTEIFQEFAGLSLKVLRESGSDYTRQLCDPKMLMVLAFQAFATLHKLHCQGVTHQDVKPENLCLDIQPKGVWRLKFIDFGSSQTPDDQTIEGLTNEYLSPESCSTILQVATEKLPREAGRLGPGTDVWALALSLLYCLLGYHVMVFVCTGRPKYQEQDPAKLQFLRMQALIKISNLTDGDMNKLIRPEWPEALKILLFNTLRVDPSKRWSAQQAAEFILKNWILKGIGSTAQRPSAAPVASPATPAASVVGDPRSMFQFLAPARLVVRTQLLHETTAPQETQRAAGGHPIQCSSPTVAGPSSPPSPASPSTSDTPSPSQLPDFSGLLSDGGASKKPQRRTRGKQRLEPYRQPSQRGSKN